MSLDGIVKGSYGQPIVLTAKDVDPPHAVIDISGYTSFYVQIRDPEGNIATNACALYTDGKDGNVIYTLQDGDIDDGQTWYIRVKCVSGSSVLHSLWLDFEVEE